MFVYSLFLDLSCLWVFHFLGFVQIQEEILEEPFGLGEALGILTLVFKGDVFLVVFRILKDITRQK